MTEQVTERMVVRADPARCFAVAVDFEHYPEWASEVKQVTVLERDEAGRGTLVGFRTAGLGRSLSYTLRYSYDAAPGGLSWVQTKGDLTRKLDGSYAFDAAGEGTEVTYHLLAELVVPIPGFVKRRAEGRIMHTALKELKARAESGAAA